MMPPQTGQFQSEWGASADGSAVEVFVPSESPSSRRHNGSSVARLRFTLKIRRHSLRLLDHSGAHLNDKCAERYEPLISELITNQKSAVPIGVVD
jgi:hypothetical protein